MTRNLNPVILWVIIVSCASTALAHDASGTAGGFISGFLHPIFGWDHVVAMVAVGLWGAFLGAPAIWALPVIFPMVMALGGVLGVAGVPLPAVEITIALSAVVLGAMVGLAARPSLWIAGAIVGVFAVFHGHAHGTELPHAASPLTYSIGFVMATGMLHLCGISFGLLTRWPHGKIAVRIGGALISLVGVAFLFGIL